MLKMNGSRTTAPLRSLERLQGGARGVVHDVQGGKDFAGRLAAMGLAVGAEIAVLENRGQGPLLVLVRDTRIALGRSEALKIIVEES